MNAALIPVAAALAVLSLGPVFAASPEPPGAASCSGCHPPTVAPAIAVPPLHGRPADEIASAMQGFKAGQLQPTVMDRIAKGFTDDEIRAMAVWFSAQREERRP